MTILPSPKAAPDRPLRVSAIVGFLVFVELASGFVQGYYNPLFSEIARHNGVSDADITWFIVVQTLSAAVSVPILSRLGDIFGHRRILRIAMLLVLAGVLVVAFSANYALVLVGRVLVGPLAVWLPLEVSLIHSRIKGQTARKAIGFLVSALTLGVVVGTLAAGVASTIIRNLTGVMLVPAAFIAVGVLAVFFAVPESATRTRKRLDYLGFAGLAAVMCALLWGLRQAQVFGFASADSMLPLLAAAALLVAWVAWERRTQSPAVDLRVLGARTLWPIYAASFLAGTVIFGTVTILPTFLASDPVKAGYGLALSPGAIALYTAFTTICSTAGAAVFSYAARVIGLRGVLMSGAVIGAVGYVLLAFLHREAWQIWLGIGLTGFSAGVLTGALPAAIAEAAPPDQTGIATGVYSSIKTLGGSAAGAVFGVVLASLTFHGSKAPTDQGYATVWLLSAAAFALCPLVLAALRPARRRLEEPLAETSNETASSDIALREVILQENAPQENIERTSL